MDISGREENTCSFPVHLMASVPLMAEEGVVGMSPGYSVLMLRQTLSKTGACFTKILLITGGTRNSIGAHLRGTFYHDSPPNESPHLPVLSLPYTEEIYSLRRPLQSLNCRLSFRQVNTLRRNLVHTCPPSTSKKLKQALASSNTAARPGCSKTSRANTADRIAEMTRSRNFSGTSSTEVNIQI
ncbi:uncharacterized protein [Penaeus vannamei]|uniref:uncharacterized protein isoform X1 n=1 Tax=Penaeus vannamei TaxID=6689 RepID=UPI00387F69DA